MTAQSPLVPRSFLPPSVPSATPTERPVPGARPAEDCPADQERSSQRDPWTSQAEHRDTPADLPPMPTFMERFDRTPPGGTSRRPASHAAGADDLPDPVAPGAHAPGTDPLPPDHAAAPRPVHQTWRPRRRPAVIDLSNQEGRPGTPFG